MDMLEALFVATVLLQFQLVLYVVLPIERVKTDMVGLQNVVVVLVELPCVVVVKGFKC